MFTLNLARTREYHPRDFENFLHRIQKTKREISLSFHNSKEKVQIFCSENLEEVFSGAKCEQLAEPLKQAKFYAKQSKGTLLPIKRYAQFEDRINKERIYSMDNLIFALAGKKDAHIKFIFKSMSDHKRESALKKAKKYYFKPERLFDQWESRG